MDKKLVNFPIDGLHLQGELVLPPKAENLIIFSHGSEGCRSNPVNQKIAKGLQQAGFGTLMVDLLHDGEDEEEYRFDIDLLSNRLVDVTMWIYRHIKYRSLNLAYLGSGIGTASALKAAATLKNTIKAVVSHRGRPDLVKRDLPGVISPTLLIVGEYDMQTIKLNEQVLRYLKAPRQLVVIPSVVHNFKEPGKMNQTIRLSVAWFEKYLSAEKYIARVH